MANFIKNVTTTATVKKELKSNTYKIAPGK